MTEMLLLVAAYGLMFGLQNKARFLYSDSFLQSGEKKTMLDRLLQCSYCLGFHCGWLTWVAGWLMEGSEWSLDHALARLLHMVVWCFASAAFCYVLDTGVRRLERT